MEMQLFLESDASSILIHVLFPHTFSTMMQIFVPMHPNILELNFCRQHTCSTCFSLHGWTSQMISAKPDHLVDSKEHFLSSLDALTNRLKKNNKTNTNASFAAYVPVRKNSPQGSSKCGIQLGMYHIEMYHRIKKEDFGHFGLWDATNNPS